MVILEWAQEKQEVLKKKKKKWKNIFSPQSLGLHSFYSPRAVVVCENYLLIFGSWAVQNLRLVIETGTKPRLETGILFQRPQQCRSRFCREPLSEVEVYRNAEVK